MTVKLVDLIQPVRSIAEKAGFRIVEIYKGGFSVTEKSDKSPVTEADFAAHDIIVEGLNLITPHIPVLSEEDSDISFATRARWEWLWLVDPLDGTREFIRRNDEFSVNIALVHQHTVLFGLILIPITGVCYYAYHQGGAFKQVPHHHYQQIHTCVIGQRIPRVIGSSYTGRRLNTFLSDLGHHHYTGVGSSLKSCLVAEGEADLYPRFGPTYEWDTAAAQIIVEEAGGRLTDTQMQPLRYNARPTLVNPDFFVFGDCSHDWSQYLPKPANPDS
jgi:3'(2'), 5'-bisphosphate nucleotidase